MQWCGIVKQESELEDFEKGWDEGTYGACYSPDGTKIVTGHIQSARIWDVQTGKKLFTLPVSKQSGSFAFSPDGSQLVTANDGKVWNAISGEELFSLNSQKHNLEFWVTTPVAYSPEGMRIVTANNNGTETEAIVTWDARTGEELNYFQYGENRNIGHLSFSPDGKHLLMDTERPPDAQQFKRFQQEMEALEKPIEAKTSEALFGEHFSASCGIEVWDAETGKVLSSLNQAFPISTLSYSPDGNRILFANGRVQIWNGKN